MLNIDAGTIKRKIDSNEYDDEIIQEAQVQYKSVAWALGTWLFFPLLSSHTHIFITITIRVISRTLSCIFF